jgi:Ca-activated chloride channel homolog
VTGNNAKPRVSMACADELKVAQTKEKTMGKRILIVVCLALVMVSCKEEQVAKETAPPAAPTPDVQSAMPATDVAAGPERSNDVASKQDAEPTTETTSVATAPETDRVQEEIWRRVAASPPVPLDPEAPITQGQMRAAAEDGQLVALPLAHTKVEAAVSGTLAGIWVTQYFTNTLDKPIEAIYVFPLPQMAAVDDMEMVIGERTIRSEMKRREEARKVYEEAKAAGKTASLLEQERPNMFTQSVANILPGDRIRVRIHYVQDLRYDDGSFEFIFPMVVGPRFIPGSQVADPAVGGAPPTAAVPDANRITPPVLDPGKRSGHDIEVHLALQAGVKVARPASPSHDILVKQVAGGGWDVTLASDDQVPNKDFVVRYRTAGEDLQVAPLLHASALGNYFMLFFQPEAEPKDEDVVPRELIFVVDCSGSMSGPPLDKAREAMKRVLKNMRPADSFQVIKFSDAANGFSPGPVPNTPENVARAVEFLDGMRGTGGTAMVEGIKASLDYPQVPERMRIVAFMTDGYIGNETAILHAIEQKRGNARLFSFGIGSSVNRFLLDRMSEVGRGYVTYVRQDESPEAAVERFFRRIDSPVLTEIEVSAEGEGIKLFQLFPTPILDLFAGQPLVVFGRFQGKGKGAFVVKGRRGAAAYEQRLPVDFPESTTDHAVLATLWARARIKYLMDKMNRGEDPDIKEHVTLVSLKHRLMSKYTSLVAVEENARTEPGSPETVKIALPMPEGVSHKGVFGSSNDSNRAARVKSMVSNHTSVGMIGSNFGTPSDIGGGSFGSGLSTAKRRGGPVVTNTIGAKLSKMDSDVKYKVKEKKYRLKVLRQSGGAGSKVDQAAVNRYMRARSSAFERCYMRVARKNPNVGGKVVLQLHIDLSGRARAKVVTDQTGDPVLAKCMISKIQGWQFPRPQGKPVKLKIPFVFRSSGGGATTATAPTAPAEPVTPPEPVPEPVAHTCEAELKFIVVLDGAVSEAEFTRLAKAALQQAAAQLTTALPELAGPPTGWQCKAKLSIQPNGQQPTVELDWANASKEHKLWAAANSEFKKSLGQLQLPAYTISSLVKLEASLNCNE